MKKQILLSALLASLSIMGGRLPRKEYCPSKQSGEALIKVTVEDYGNCLKDLNNKVFERQKVNRSYLKIMQDLHTQIQGEQNISERLVLMAQYVCAYNRLSERSFNNPKTRARIILENNGALKEMYKIDREMPHIKEKSKPEKLISALLVSEDILAGKQKSSFNVVQDTDHELDENQNNN